MDTFRIIKSKDPTQKYFYVRTDIIQNPNLSLEGKGTYGMLQAGKLSINDVPENIIEELRLCGCFDEVQE